jgi:hypothetical protein
MHNRINMLSKIATANMLSKKAAEIVNADVVDNDPWPTTIATRTNNTNSTAASGKTRFGSLKEKGSAAFAGAKGWVKKHPYKAGGAAALAVTLVGGGATWATLNAREKKNALEKARAILAEQEKQMTYAGIGAGVGGLAGAGLGYGLSNENKGRNALLAGLAGAGLGAGAGYMMA